MGPRFKVSFERLGKPGIESTTPDLEGGQFNHYAMEASETIGEKGNITYKCFFRKYHICSCYFKDIFR